MLAIFIAHYIIMEGIYISRFIQDILEEITFILENLVSTIATEVRTAGITIITDHGIMAEVLEMETLLAHITE